MRLGLCGLEVCDSDGMGWGGEGGLGRRDEGEGRGGSGI